MARPTLVVVTGPPASGKTTLAHELARAIPCPAVLRDEIKEGLVHAQGGDYVPAPGDELTQRALPIFAEVLRVLVMGGVTVVAEAAFQDRLWRQVLEPLDDAARVKIVHCTVAPDVSWDRATHRSSVKPSHIGAHGDSTLGKTVADWAQLLETFERISLAAPSITVDTTDGYAPALADIVAFVGATPR